MKVQKSLVKVFDEDAAAKRLAMILFGDQLAESFRKLSSYYSKIMHERMYYGLGAEFVSPLAYEKKQLRAGEGPRWWGCSGGVL